MLEEALHMLKNYREIGELVMGNVLIKSAAVDFAIQWILWVAASVLKTEKFYDLAGSSTFLLLAVKSLQWNGTFYPRQQIQSAAIVLWAIRLGLFLFTRIMKDGHDRRFNKVRDNPSVFFIYWTLQAVWILVTMMPSLILNSKKRDTPLTTRDYVGWGIWLVGFLMETVADYQKTAFKKDPSNAGKFITTGLWKYSRHPNYFGEILLWFGLYMSASSTFRGIEYLSVLSPVFVGLLITKISGVPMLEQMALKRWGQNAAYLAYRKKTPVLIPFLW